MNQFQNIQGQRVSSVYRNSCRWKRASTRLRSFDHKTAKGADLQAALDRDARQQAAAARAAHPASAHLRRAAEAERARAQEAEEQLAAARAAQEQKRCRVSGLASPTRRQQFRLPKCPIYLQSVASSSIQPRTSPVKFDRSTLGTRVNLYRLPWSPLAAAFGTS